MGTTKTTNPKTRDGQPHPQPEGATLEPKWVPTRGSPPPPGLCGLPHWEDGGAPIHTVYARPNDDPREGNWNPVPALVGCKVAVPPPEHWKSIWREARRIDDAINDGPDGTVSETAVYSCANESRHSDECNAVPNPCMWEAEWHRMGDHPGAAEMTIMLRVEGTFVSHWKRMRVAMQAEKLRRWGVHGPWQKETFDHADWQERLRAENVYLRLSQCKSAVLNPTGHDARGVEVGRPQRAAALRGRRAFRGALGGLKGHVEWDRQVRRGALARGGAEAAPSAQEGQTRLECSAYLECQIGDSRKREWRNYRERPKKCTSTRA